MKARVCATDTRRELPGAFGSGTLDSVGSTQLGTVFLADGTLGEISLRKSPRQRPRLWPFWHLASFDPTCKGCRTRRAEQRRRRKRMRIVLDMSGMADRPPRESPFFLHRPSAGSSVRGEVEMRGFDGAILKDAFIISAAPAAAFLNFPSSFSAHCAFHEKKLDDRDTAGNWRSLFRNSS